MERTTSLSSFILRPTEAKFFKDHNLLFKQKPYCVITIGDSEFSTSVDAEGGLNPHWSNKFNIEGTEGFMAYVKVYDRELVANDYLLGEAAFSITKSFFGEKRSENLDLFKDNQKVGSIVLQFSPFFAQESSTGAPGLPTEQSLDLSTDASSTSLNEKKSLVDSVKDQVSHLGEKVSTMMADKQVVHNMKEQASNLGAKLSESVAHLVHKEQTQPEMSSDKTQEMPEKPIKGVQGTTLIPDFPDAGKDFSTSNNHSSTEFPSSKIPENLDLKPLKPVLISDKLTGAHVEDFKPVDLTVQGDVNHSFPVQILGESKPADSLGEWKAQGEVHLDQTRVDYFGQDPHPSNAHVGQKIREDMEATGLAKTEIDFKMAEPNSAQDNWSTVSNADSAMDRADLESLETKAGLLEQGKQKINELAPKVVEQGKQLAGKAQEKAAQYTEQGKQLAHNVEGKALETYHKAETKIEEGVQKGDQIVRDASHLVEDKANQAFEQSKQIAGNLKEKAVETFHSTQAQVQHGMEVANEYVADKASMAQAKLGDMYVQGKQTTHDLKEKAKETIHTAEVKGDQAMCNTAHYVEGKAFETVEQGKKIASNLGEKSVEAYHSAQHGLEKANEYVANKAQLVGQKAGEAVEQGKVMASDLKEKAKDTMHTVEVKGDQAMCATAHFVEEKAFEAVEQGKKLASNLGEKSVEAYHSAQHGLEKANEYVANKAQLVGQKAGEAVEQGKVMASDLKEKAKDTMHTVEVKGDKAMCTTAHFVEEKAFEAVEQGKVIASDLKEKAKDTMHTVQVKSDKAMCTTAHFVEEKAFEAVEQGKHIAEGLKEKAVETFHTLETKGDKIMCDTAHFVEEKAQQVYEQGKHMTEGLKEKTEETLHKTQETAGHAMEQGKHLASEAGHKAQETAGHAVEQGRGIAQVAGEKTVEAFHNIQDGVVELTHKTDGFIQTAAHFIEAKATEVFEQGKHLASNINEKVHHAFAKSETDNTIMVEAPAHSGFNWTDHSDKIVVGKHLGDEGYEQSPTDNTHHTTNNAQMMAHDMKEKLIEAGQKLSEYIAEGKEKMSNLNEKAHDMLAAKEHPHLPVDKINNTTQAIIEKPAEEDGRPSGDVGEPAIVDVSKELPSTFSQKTQGALGRSGSQVEKLGEPEGPSDIDIVDIGPQDFNIDTKYNDASTFDKGSEMQKQAVFDTGFSSNEKLIKKAEEITSHEGVNDFGHENLTDKLNEGVMDKSGDKINRKLSFGRTDSDVNKTEDSISSNKLNQSATTDASERALLQ